MRFGEIRGRLRPVGAMRGLAATIGGWREVESMLDGEEAVDALARVLDVAIERSVTIDGRIDLRNVAADVLEAVGRVKRTPLVGKRLT